MFKFKGFLILHMFLKDILIENLELYSSIQCLKDKLKASNDLKGRVMKIEKALINDYLCVLKVS